MVSLSELSGYNVEEAMKSTVLTSDGKVVSFGCILNQQNSNVNRTLVVFIRHFFCGNCQEYIRRLATDLNPSTLPQDLSITIVGCGAPSLIPSYASITACPFPLYADPSTQLYKLLGMQKSLSLGSKDPAYIQHSLASGVVKSIMQGLKRIPSGDVRKAGDLSVNGGEFLFTRNGSASEWKISWSHRMLNSRDHTEIDTLRARLGLEGQLPSSEVEELGSTEELSHIDSLKHSSDIRGQPSSVVRRSLSIRRHSWMSVASHLSRSSSMRKVVQVS